MKDYVGCNDERTGKLSLIMCQDDLIDNIKKAFGEKVNNMQGYELLAGSGEYIKRPKEDEPAMSK